MCIFNASIRAGLTVSGSKVSCPIAYTCPFRSFQCSFCQVPAPFFLPKSRRASSSWEAWNLCNIVPAHPPRDSSRQCTRPRFGKRGRKGALWQDLGSGFTVSFRLRGGASCWGAGTLSLLLQYLLLPLNFQVLGMSVMNKVCDIFELTYLNTNHAPWKCSKHRCPLDLFPEERIPISN